MGSAKGRGSQVRMLQSMRVSMYPLECQAQHAIERRCPMTVANARSNIAIGKYGLGRFNKKVSPIRVPLGWRNSNLAGARNTCLCVRRYLALTQSCHRAGVTWTPATWGLPPFTPCFTQELSFASWPFRPVSSAVSWNFLLCSVHA